MGHDRNDMPNRKCWKNVKTKNHQFIQLAMTIRKLIQALAGKELQVTNFAIGYPYTG
jgi:hypothetical protein